MKGSVGENEPASIAVMRIVAGLECCDPLALGTLQKAVDVDEMDELVNSSRVDTVQGPRSISFQYCGYSIEPHSDGVVCVEN